MVRRGFDYANEKEVKFIRCIRNALKVFSPFIAQQDIVLEKWLVGNADLSMNKPVFNEQLVIRKKCLLAHLKLFLARTRQGHLNNSITLANEGCSARTHVQVTKTLFEILQKQACNINNVYRQRAF